MYVRVLQNEHGRPARELYFARILPVPALTPSALRSDAPPGAGTTVPVTHRADPLLHTPTGVPYPDRACFGVRWQAPALGLAGTASCSPRPVPGSLPLPPTAYCRIGDTGTHADRPIQVNPCRIGPSV
ncbi:hypothetical protein PICMEDRAFT_114314 [Pichia membranifaciens NRRL Y-2026]|uniref:Uncharacterized protein n=1 Tax=Pichia membranifaciens NRRL Y-2026 TaxID=763406 RepID=A0A1E3NPL8_9ASCO|nr:hypothetical protein PICMEDRAFT_114314 [Pichia membranifaciens NRRL Y-2026]ODQ47493.1 hypothetical protein PICMEDRAFT_114314 [Pichia membranifaciens NRRL Y-2026]